MYMNPYSNVQDSPEQAWLKTALHVHTTRSDGQDTPQETIAHFESLGFDAIAITDHDLLGEPSQMQGHTILLQGIEHSQGSHIGQIGDLRIANHPDWHFDHWDFYRLQQRNDIHAIEIFNALIETHPGSPLSTNIWDQLLSCGKRLHGIASDDAHAAAHRGFAWVNVCAERNPDSVQQALEHGRFYATTGLDIERIFVEQQTLHIQTIKPCAISFYGDQGRLLHKTIGNHAAYEFKNGDAYIRIECHGDQGQTAWTNPIWLLDTESETKRTQFRKRMENHRPE